MLTGNRLHYPQSINTSICLIVTNQQSPDSVDFIGHKCRMINGEMNFNDMQNGLASWKINVSLCFNGTKADITLRLALVMLLWLAQRLAEAIYILYLTNFNLKLLCTKSALEKTMISAMCPLLSVVVLGITLL